MRRPGIILAMLLMALATPAAADQWRSQDAYTVTVTTHRPLIAILDMTTERSQPALSDGSNFARAIVDHMTPGKPIVIYHDYGNGLKLMTPREGVLKPTPCKARPGHPFAALGQKPCAKEGYEAAMTAFVQVIDQGFSPYFEESDSNQSKPFVALAEAATDQSLAKDVGADIFYLTDALPYNEVVRFSASASWLHQEQAREGLQEKLILRGLIPDLRGYRVHLVGIGRSLNGRSTLSSDTTQALAEFWQWYGSLTGAALTMSPTFGSSSIELLQNLETVQ